MPHPLLFFLPFICPDFLLIQSSGFSSFFHQSQSPPSQYSPHLPVLGGRVSSLLIWRSNERAEEALQIISHRSTRLARTELAVQYHCHILSRFWPWKRMKILLNAFLEIFLNKLPFNGQYPKRWSLSKSEEVAHQRESASSLRAMHSAYHLPLSLKGNTQGAPKVFPPSVYISVERNRSKALSLYLVLTSVCSTPWTLPSCTRADVEKAGQYFITTTFYKAVMPVRYGWGEMFKINSQTALIWPSDKFMSNISFLSGLLFQ